MDVLMRWCGSYATEIDFFNQKRVSRSKNRPNIIKTSNIVKNDYQGYFCRNFKFVNSQSIQLAVFQFSHIANIQKKTSFLKEVFISIFKKEITVLFLVLQQV